MPATSTNYYIVESIRYAIPYIFLPWVTWTVWKFVRRRNQHSLRSVAVVVLGDIGRSPRMMYHAQSFAENDFVTDIIGYGGLYLGHYVNEKQRSYVVRFETHPHTRTSAQSAISLPA